MSLCRVAENHYGQLPGRDHNAAVTILSKGLVLLAQLAQGIAESHAWGEGSPYTPLETVVCKPAR
jgi:hypothetical protein